MAAPRYRQIADDLQQQIESGGLAPGARLPTEYELMERYSVSRNTVRDAVKVVMTRGLVHTRPGQGTFVTAKIEPFIVRAGMSPYEGEIEHAFTEPHAGRAVEVSPVQVEIQVGLDLVCAELGVPASSQLISRHQRVSIDSVPWSLRTSFYPMYFVERGATRLYSPDDIVSGAVQYLRETLGLKQVGWQDRLTVRAPAPVEAEFFRLPPDGRVSVIETFRTAYDGNATPMRLTVAVYPADRNQFVYTVGQVPPPGERAAGPADQAGDRRHEDRAPAVVALER